MADLGYDRYGVQGGDWGAQVAERMADLDPEHCVALHLNMAIANRPKEDVELSEADQADLAAMASFGKEESAYSQLQGTKPQTLGAGLMDSPAGLLSWIVEKFRAWSDCDGDPENAFSRDQLITNVMLYWLTGTITSSTRLYWENLHSAERAPKHISVPTGIARFPKEPIRFPRPWVEAKYDVTHWAEMPRGGHFAAMEQPALFVDDIRTFFEPARDDLAGQARLVTNLTVSLMVGWVSEIDVTVRANEALRGAESLTVTMARMRWTAPGARIGVR